MDKNQVMALAAMCQITKAVQKVAQTGSITDYEMQQLLSGILVTNPDAPSDVFRDMDLRQGYQLVVEQLDPGQNKSIELVKYVGGLIQLERALNANPKALNELATRISSIENRLAHLSISDDAIIASLADIYADVISPLGQRIQVFGKPALLQQQSVQHRIRALLLAGIRAAVLWRQVGGKRRHFFFGKGKIVKIAKQYC
ncbi:high frequency lysogenization protein HflD [Pseudoalteromonas sp. SSM20]|uniref:high frequency lysogenization protein HflD n=1 Tax=unclassified Pseudoalteromonas TaxID=194690 RepID=UPI0035633046